jgi:F0F1-type ATP synthase membrane subunit c/vacuolar-type H+-ATPase subunit K
MRARRNKTSHPTRPDEALDGAGGRPKRSARALAQIIERSSRIQGPAAEAYVSRLRHAHPGAGPAEIVAKLEKRYVAVVTAGGVAVGAAATIPGIGTFSALSAAAAETVAFLEATALFVLALAVVYGIPAEHRERRRALVLSVLAGDNSKHAVAELIGPSRTQGGWIAEGVAAAPLSSMSRLNSRLLKSWVKRYTVRRSALLFGKMLPVGIGAIVGAIGNRLAGRKIVRNARQAFGAPPTRWPSPLRVLPPIDQAG